MAGFVRLVLGVLLLPAAWGLERVLIDAIVIAADAEGAFSVESLSLLGGIAAFSLVWAALPHPVRTYVFGHELTHALWGLFFGARPGKIKITSSGGSVMLSKENFIITLAPYFFPFYTFLVIVAALVTSAFLHPLPFLPLWLFLVGFTWAFHVLFTLETLTRRQPDVKLYGRVFSWVFIYLANVAIILVWLASMTSLSFSELGALLAKHLPAPYLFLYSDVLRRMV